MGSDTQDIIRTPVAESYGKIGFGSRTAIKHIVDTRLWVHIHQSYLMGYGIPAIVDDTNLHTTRMAKANIKQTNLRTIQGISIIVAAQLHATHIGRADIGCCNLQASLHTHGNIGKSTQLHAAERRTGYIIK